ncbi:Snake venom serine protease PTLE1 [Dissostichus eleginoides]|uniref:Snake venom serine protease PTLE1 n=1 Tax=Dissostichus eleginoides TaxID=100907 RepID=A0AAD9F6T0_DISEL|nr:Snake venom serine protease PTLE1 [Dissostichus eleginoides]
MADIRARRDVFSWTDDEVELLLRVTLDYKTTKVQENVDWESCKSKYSDIGDAFQKQYPRTPTEKDFPHDASAITKVQHTVKIKQIPSKYTHAVDTGRWSGQGRVVLLFFELCEEVWGGSPATRTISSGIETGDLEESSSGPSLERSNDSPESSESSGSLPDAAVVRHRRDLLQAKLNGHRSDCLKRKLPADHAVQEDLQIKKEDV